MIYYKDDKNNVHRLDDKKFESMLPAGSVEISKEEADFLRNPPSEHHTLTEDGTEWKITPENQALKNANKNESIRLDVIKTEQESSGLKGITVDQAKTYINNEISGMSLSDPDKLILARVLRKMAVYLLK